MLNSLISICESAGLNHTDGWIALLTLAAMEIVLGIDNIIFIAILVSKLPKALQPRARTIGIALALISRLALLFSITWVMSLTQPLFSIADKAISGRDLILLLGGLFLIGKATFELHDKLEGAEDGHGSTGKKASSMMSILIQIVIIDIVFSLDSVITAVGMAQSITIMVIAMVGAVFVMLIAAGAISDFVHRHPTIKILALSFLVLIGSMLLMEGMGNHVNKGYIYFAMAFSLLVEMLNMRLRKKSKPVALYDSPRAKS